MDGQRVVITIPARVFPEIAGQIEEEFARKVDREGAEYALDLGGVNNVYSDVLNLIMRIAREIAAHGSSIALVNVSPKVRSVLCTMRVDLLMPMYETMFDYEFERDLAMAG